MASVMQGDAYNIPVTIKSGNGTLITPEIAACVEITVGQFTKRWPGQVTFDEKTGEWQFPVTQKQTFRFAPGAAVVQARVVFQDGSIMGGSGAPICVEQSASRGTLPQPEKTEAVTGSAPNTTEVTIPTVHDIDVSLHSQVILSDPIKAPYIGDNGNWYEYDAATGTFVDTGTAASGTPPITPDTAGKFLTNDGSKAEWAKIESNLFLVHLIQGEPDADDNPTYTVDKTFAEIKTAYDAGKKVELDISECTWLQNVPSVLMFGSNYASLVRCTSKLGIFMTIGQSLVANGIVGAPGGVPLGILQVNVNKDDLVQVRLPWVFKEDGVQWVGDAIVKLPQQYIVNVASETDGTLSANSTFAQLQSVMQAYGMDTDISGAASINAVYNGKLYYMSASTDTSITFAATTENGLATLTVSNDGKEGSTDVWTHTVTPIDNKVIVTLTYQNGKYTPSIGAWTINSAAQAGKNVVLKNPDGDGEIPLVYSSSYDIGVATFTFAEQKSSIYQRIESPYVVTWEIRGKTVATRYRTPLPPAVTSSDNGKFLRVVDGAWAAAEITNANGVNF